MPLADIWDQQVLTTLVKRNIDEQAQQNTGGENRAFFGQNIAPLQPVQSRVVKLRIQEVQPYGLGQFKAPDSTPPLYKAKPNLKEQVIELADLDEMERFTGTDWMLLNSNDPQVATGQVLDLAQRLRALQLRNDRLTEFMRWQAFKGTLTITYRGAGTVLIDYGFDMTHLPTAGTAWTDTVNSDPIADLRAWSLVGADDVGQYYSIVHLNTQTWYLITRNQNIRAYLSALGRSIMLPTRADLQQLMREGTGNFEIIDSGYLAENAENRRLTKFIPDNRVLLSTDYVLNGERIAWVADGQVLIGGDTGTPPDVRQGSQSELIADPFSKNVFRRQASARMPVLQWPEAFLYATVGS